MHLVLVWVIGCLTVDNLAKAYTVFAKSGDSKKWPNHLFPFCDQDQEFIIPYLSSYKTGFLSLLNDFK